MPIIFSLFLIFGKEKIVFLKEIITIYQIIIFRLMKLFKIKAVGKLLKNISMQAANTLNRENKCTVSFYLKEKE